MGCVALGLGTSALLCGLSLVLVQRCGSLTIWIYFALIFQCRHLIPAKSRAGQVTGFFLLSFSPSTNVCKSRLVCFIQLTFSQLTFLSRLLEMERQHGCTSKLKTTRQASGFSDSSSGLACGLVTSYIPFASPCPFCYTLNFITVRGQAE